MSAKAEVTESVRGVVRTLLARAGSGEESAVSEADVSELAHRGVIFKGGSGYGGGWEVDSDVAQVLGLTEFDYS